MTVSAAVFDQDRLRDQPGYSRVWTAAGISGFGSYVTTLAIQVLIVVRLGGGATQVGLVNAARWLPYLLFGAIAGALIDRTRRRPIMLASDLGRGAVLLAVPILAGAGDLSIPVLMVLMATFGLLQLFGDAAFMAFVPRLVPNALLAPAHASFDQSDAVAQSSGPALAGAVISLVGAPLAVLVESLSYLVASVLMWRLPVPEVVPERPAARNLRGEVLEGMRWVYRRGPLLALAIHTQAWFLCSAVAGAVLVPFALTTLGLSAFALGLALALAGLGGLVGSSLAVRLGTRFGTGRVVVACYAGCAVGWGLMAAAVSLGSWAFFLGQLVWGLSLGASNANEMGYRQSITPDRLQGRVNATMRSANRGMIVLGAPIGGLLAHQLGYAVMLGASAAGFLVVAVTLGSSSFAGVRMTAT